MIVVEDTTTNVVEVINEGPQGPPGPQGPAGQDGSSVADGDKGDIIVSGSGTTWEVQAKGITYAKIQDVSATDKILGRSSAGAGTVEEIPCTAAGRALLDDIDATAQRATLGAGDVNGPVSATDNAVARFDGSTGKLIQSSTATLSDSGALDVVSATTDFLQLDTVATPTSAEGRLTWDAGNGSVLLGLKGGVVTLVVGEQEYVRAYNDSGAGLTLGQVVYISGAQGNRVAVKLAQANNDTNSKDTIGLVAEPFANGAEGWVLTSGTLSGLNTDSLTAGDSVYLSATVAGAYTTTKPTAPSHTVVLGFVQRQHATVGSLYIKVDNGYELEELHNVLISTPVTGHLLTYNATTSLWTNQALQVSATDKLLGRISAGAGSVEEITCTAAGRALLDDADASAQRTTLGLGTLATQSGTFSGSSSGTNTGDQTITLTGDVTGSGTGTFAATIANSAVTYAKLQNVSATDKLLGRATAGAGVVEEITCTAAGRALLDDTDASAQRTTLGLGSLATQSGTFSGSSSGTNTGDQNLFSTIAVAGQSDVVADSVSDTLTLVAGTNITITTNAASDTITINSTGGGGGGGVSDGDKGDILVADSGATWTIDTGVVSFAKMQNIDTQRLLGRATTGSGVVEQLGIGAGLAISSGSLTVVPQNLFNKIEVAGQTTIEADGPLDSLTIAAGNFISLTTNATTDTLTVAATGVQKTITSGTAAPSGGVDGDIYLQYT